MQGWMLEFRQTLRKGALGCKYLLHMLYRNYIRWNQVKFFIMSGNWKSISLCKLFEVIWFSIVLCLHSCWGAFFGTFAHNFCFILTNIWLVSELKCSSKVINKLSAKLSKWEPSWHLWKRGARGGRLVRLPFGNTQAMRLNCNNFQILPDCIVWNGVFRNYYYKYIILTCSISCEMIWAVVPNLKFCP